MYPLTFTTGPGIDQTLTFTSSPNDNIYRTFYQGVNMRIMSSTQTFNIQSSVVGLTLKIRYTRSPAVVCCTQTVKTLTVFVFKSLLATTPNVKFIQFYHFNKASMIFTPNTNLGITGIGTYWTQRCIYGFDQLNWMVQNNPFFKFDLHPLNGMINGATS